MTCPPFLQSSQGSFLFISSITGLSALGATFDYFVAYTTIAHIQNLARKVAPRARVDVISPGNIFFLESSWEEKVYSNPETVESMLWNYVPLQPFDTHKEIADAAVFLCSP